MHVLIQADMAHGYEEKEGGRAHMMFSDWGPQWLEMKRCYVKTSTYAAYRTTMINHLLPAFGGMELAAITQERVQSRILYWAAYGRLDGRGVCRRRRYGIWFPY